MTSLTRAEAETRAAMAAWEAENTQHRHGKHEYVTADYGITPEQIATACAAYRKRFIEKQTRLG